MKIQIYTEAERRTKSHSEALNPQPSSLLHIIIGAEIVENPFHLWYQKCHYFVSKIYSQNIILGKIKNSYRSLHKEILRLYENRRIIELSVHKKDCH
jgi:hypothetical protein